MRDYGDEDDGKDTCAWLYGHRDDQPGIPLVLAILALTSALVVILEVARGC